MRRRNPPAARSSRFAYGDVEVHSNHHIVGVADDRETVRSLNALVWASGSERVLVDGGIYLGSGDFSWLGGGTVTDATWVDTFLAIVLIGWGLFVVFGGLAALGWWLGGVFLMDPPTPAVGRIPFAKADPLRTAGESQPVARWHRPGPGGYIIYDDPHSTAQVFEDDREWRLDRMYTAGD